MVEDSPDDGNFLVRVRAQVMTRDDSTGGWVPLGGGGLSNVSVRKRIISEDEKKPEYVIFGKRLSDQTTVLSCSIKKDFQYNKVMPTFHHWRTDEKKFGLTFQTAADARLFDKGVRTAIEDLLDAFSGVGYVHNVHGDDDLGDDDVFMTLELPVESRSSTGSSSESANGANTCRPTSATSSIPGDTFSISSSPYTHPHSNQHHLHCIHFMKPSRTMPGVSSSGASGLSSSVSVGAAELLKAQAEEVWVKDRTNLKDSNTNGHENVELATLGSYSYVQFSKNKGEKSADHEYCYPAIETVMGGKEYSTDSLKKSVSTVSSEPPLLPSKGSSKESRRQSSPSQLRCRLCLDEYTEDNNLPGSCRFGPDRTLNCINNATCFSCAQCMLYHCMSDAEGDFNHHPCACEASDDHCRRRWAGLALLSIFVPCLWCYLPLRACHRCGVRCGHCGGRHQPE
ncbi:sprouty-related, EVH1 domain-containing protein 2 [Trichonephila clavipes]|uniref:Sprouty-related, EVH1 domain-containing protein 2 n=1 Tax=Trichonephila clavipes TaxID=2585209 RepID=A0A8X6WBE0_TRICX|nr:sprouty-related, EVH1 domain-containing protein 2 [Trichonephila clavipes]